VASTADDGPTAAVTLPAARLMGDSQERILSKKDEFIDDILKSSSALG
jgi:hypothetical protein